MYTINFKDRLTGPISLAFGAIMLLFFFSAPPAVAGAVAVVKSLDGSHTLCKKLVAGQSIEVGTVCLAVVGDSLNITYNVTASGWSLSQTHFWTGTRVEDMPQNKAGNPVIGKFPYKSPILLSGSTSYVQSIPLINLSFACPTDKDLSYYAAAHAVVIGPSTNSETAWGDGDRITLQGNWGMYFNYTLSCSNNEAERRCETAFAVEPDWVYLDQGTGNLPAGSTCFLDLNDNVTDLLFISRSTGGKPQGDFSRWGWSNGPLTEGSYEYDIYAGAGRCLLASGEHVGTLGVNYASDGMVTVNYQLFSGPWMIDQLHVYSGTEALPRDVNDSFTVAPGQYTIVKDHVENGLTDTSTLGPFEGPVYVVAHTTVCKNL